MFAWNDADADRKPNLVPGDVVMVHRRSQSAGHGHNRMIKATGLVHLNAILARADPGYASLDVDAPGMRRRLAELRVKRAEGALAEAQFAAAGADPAAQAAAQAAVLAQRAVLDAALALQANPAALAAQNVDVREEWDAVQLLGDWTVDGLLINMDDDAPSTETPVEYRNDGVLLNVCVGGPTKMRNDNYHEAQTASSNDWDVQVVDHAPLVLDKVFVGVFARAVRERDAGGVLRFRRWDFQLKPFSGRQALGVGAKDGEFSRLSLYAEDPFASAPTRADFERLVGAWRVGSVMDTKYASLLVNVVVEKWPVDWLRTEFGSSIGTSAELGVVAPIVAPPPGPGGGAAVLLAQQRLREAAALNVDAQVASLQALRRQLVDTVGLAAVQSAYETFRAWTDPDVQPAGFDELVRVWDVLTTLPSAAREGLRALNDPPRNAAGEGLPDIVEEAVPANGDPAAAALLSPEEAATLQESVAYKRLVEELDAASGVDRRARAQPALVAVLDDALDGA
jgi:hypothetical protein